MPSRVLIAVGGTGGHLYPAQALATQRADCEVLFAGHGLYKNPYLHPGHASVEIVSSGRIEWRLVRGFAQALRLVRAWKPDLVVGFGSFHSLPLLIAARILRVPYILHESNARAGRVNRLFASGARFTAVHFPQPSRGRAVPIVPVTRFSTLPSRQEAAQYYGLDPERPILLAFGGSQGARSIDRVVAELELPGWQLLHLTQENFEEKMERAWACADLALTRAGASTLGEQMQTCTPAILIPWPGAVEDHQMVNARELERMGGAVVIPEEEFTAPRLVQTVTTLDREAMREALAQLQLLSRPTLGDLVREELCHRV